jgi:uncharacterized membrane protein YhdT
MVSCAPLDVLSYLLYLVGWCVVAFHLDQGSSSPAALR